MTFRRRWWLAIVGVLLAFGMPVYVAQGRVREFGWRYYEGIDPLYSLLPDVRVDQAASGKTTAAIFEDRRDDMQVCTRLGVGTHIEQKLVLCNGGRVFASSWEDNAGLGWTNIDSVAPHPVYLPPLFDLDGDGRPELIAETSTSGNSGDMYLYVVTPGDQPRVWKPICNRPASTEKPFHEMGQLLDHLYRAPDGELLGYTFDHSFVFFHTSHAGSPYPRVILRFSHGQFEVAIDQMRNPLPDAAALQDGVDTCRAVAIDKYNLDDEMESLYSPLLEQMLDLIYSGHAGEAYAFLDRAWAGSAEAKAAFLADFQHRLAKSDFFPALVALGHPPLKF